MALRHLGMFLVLMAAVLPLEAKAADVFTVDVMVDVVDENAAKAREKAMLVANRQAFISVLKKITTQDGVAKLNSLNDNQIQNFVKEVSVVSEKVSDVRYIAELRVKFNQEILKKYMEEKYISFTDEASFRVVVIPVYRQFYNERPILWESENIWRTAWEGKKGSMGSAEFVTPEASSVNQEMIKLENVMDFDRTTLDWVGRNNNAEEVYVLEAVPDGIDALTVRIYAPSGSGMSDNVIRVAENQKGQLIFEAVDRVKAVIADNIKRNNLQQSQARSEIRVLYNYAKMSDWLQLQKELKEAPYVKEVKEDAMAAGKVQFRIEFAGTPERLQNVLKSRGIDLLEYGNFYTISKNR